MANDTLRHPGLEPAHPGELLAEIVIPATGKPKAEIARLLGISRQMLYDIIGGKQGVTPSVAVRLGKLFGNGAGVWLRMQQANDLWHAERRLADEIKDMPTLSV
jgi:addiction module HigA family antidote